MQKLLSPLGTLVGFSVVPTGRIQAGLWRSPACYFSLFTFYFSLLFLAAGLAHTGEAQPPAQPAITPPPQPPPRPPHPPAELPVAPKPPVQTAPPDVQDMSNAEYLMALAQVHLNFGALERAEPLLTKALENAKGNPQQLRVRSALASLCQRRNDWAGAAAHFQAALQTSTDERERAQLSFSLADACVQNKDLEQAERLLSELAKPNPKAARSEAWIRQTASRRLLQIWQQIPGKLEQVIQSAEATLAKEPKDETALDQLVEIYSGIRPDPAKAAASLEILITLRPDDSDLTFRLATLYQQSKQYEKAITLYRQRMAGLPKEQTAHLAFQIAQLMIQSGKKDEALAWAKENLGGAGAAPQQLSMLATLCENAGMPEESEAALARAAEGARQPEEKAEYLFRISESANRRKDYAKSEAQLRRVLSDFKEQKQIRARAKSLLVRLYESQGKIGELKLED